MSGRWRWIAVGTAVLVLLAALAGCGGGGRHDDGGMMGGSTGMMDGRQPTVPAGSPMGPPPTTTSLPDGRAAANGRALFLAGGCGGCHTLAAAGTTGTAGPNLDRARPSSELVTRRLTEGGAGMPAFSGSLTAAQIRAIARYVVDATR